MPPQVTRSAGGVRQYQAITRSAIRSRRAVTVSQLVAAERSRRTPCMGRVTAHSGRVCLRRIRTLRFLRLGRRAHDDDHQENACDGANHRSASRFAAAHG